MDDTKIKSKINELALKYQLSMVLLFGSRAKGQENISSDFDIAYLSKKKLDLMDESRLVCDLMEIFRSDKIDIVNIRKAPPLLMKHIFNNNKILFCADKKNYDAYRTYSLKKYIEAKPLFDLKSEYLDYRVENYKRELQHV